MCSLPLLCNQHLHVCTSCLSDMAVFTHPQPRWAWFFLSDVCVSGATAARLSHMTCVWPYINPNIHVHALSPVHTTTNTHFPVPTYIPTTKQATRSSPSIRRPPPSTWPPSRSRRAEVRRGYLFAMFSSTGVCGLCYGMPLTYACGYGMYSSAPNRPITAEYPPLTTLPFTHTHEQTQEAPARTSRHGWRCNSRLVESVVEDVCWCVRVCRKPMGRCFLVPAALVCSHSRHAHTYTRIPSTQDDADEQGITPIRFVNVEYVFKAS